MATRTKSAMLTSESFNREETLRETLRKRVLLNRGRRWGPISPHVRQGSGPTHQGDNHNLISPYRLGLCEYLERCERCPLTCNASSKYQHPLEYVTLSELRRRGQCRGDG